METGKQENKHQSETTKTESETFCGFKKGFLLPKTEADKSTTKEAKHIPSKLRDSTNSLEPDIPFIKPKSQSSEDSQYRLPEVQQAMDASRSFLENKGMYFNSLVGRLAYLLDSKEFVIRNINLISQYKRFVKCIVFCRMYHFDLQAGVTIN